MISRLAFANPWFLWGLGLLAVPLALHLMHRELPRRLVFPTIRFLLKDREFESGRRGLKDPLTLLMRLLLLAALVLLFAGPVLRSPQIGTMGGGGAAVVVCDVSMSMAAAAPDFYETAVSGLLTEQPQTAFALLASDQSVTRRVGFGAGRDAVRQAAAALRAGTLPGNHEAVIAAAAEWLATAPEPRTLYLVTDGQRWDWEPSRLPELPEGVAVKVVAPSAPAPTNLAIDGVSAEVFVRGVTHRLRATVRVRNCGVTAQETELSVISGVAKATRRIRLGADRTERFVIDLENPVGHVARAEVSADGYAPDNVWHFWIGPRPPLRLGVVSPRDAGGRKGLEMFFLRNALQVSQPGEAPFEVALLAADGLEQGELADFDWLILLDAVAGGTEGRLTRLRDYVAEGGAVLYFAGLASAENVTTMHRAGLSQVRFRGFVGGGDAGRTWSVDTLAGSSAILSLFTEEDSDLFSFPIYRMADLQPGADTRTLLRAGGEFPFLVRERLGGGLVLLCAVGLDPAWSDLPTAFSFVPLLHRVLESRADRRERGVARVSIGEPAGDRLAAAGLPPRTTVKPTPGIEIVDGIPVVSNYSRLESDLERLDDFVLEGAMTLRETGSGNPAPRNRNRNLETGVSISLRSAVALALMLAAVGEMVAANMRPRRHR